MAKKQNMGCQHLESIHEEPHPGVRITITPADSSKDADLDSQPQARPRSTHPLTQLQVYKEHFRKNSGSGYGSESDGSSSSTTSDSLGSSCTSDNCSRRSPCQFHSSQRKLSAASSQSTESSSASSATVVPEPVVQLPVVQEPVPLAPVAPVHVVQPHVVEPPVIPGPVTRKPATRPARPPKESHVSVSSLSRFNTGCSSQIPETGRNPKPTSRSQAKPRWMSLRIWALCGLAGFLFGYDTGNINGVMTMPYFENMYLGYSVRPQAVPVTDRDGVPVHDNNGVVIMGPISINSLREKLPPNNAWVESKGESGYFEWNEDGDDDDDDDDDDDEIKQDGGIKKHKRNVILEAFRYGDNKPPPWIRIERDEQPYFVRPHSLTTATEAKGKKDIDGKHGRQPPHPVWYRLPGKDKSLIVGTLSAGTCTGSLIGSDAADYLGRRVALIIACVVFVFGVICQSVSEHMDMLSMGRFVTGVGMGMVSTVVILYMCEIIEAPKRGLLVAWYQLWIALGLLVSACVNLATMDMWNTGSFRIPISLQSAWGAMLGVGLFFLPESPRWYVKMGKPEKARDALARLRGQQPKAPSVSAELSAITASHEESQLLALPGSDTFVGSWANCFRGGLGDRGSNLRRTLLGATVQLFQQISGVNFIFYFGTAFFKQQRFSNVYVIAVIMSSINVVATFASFWLVDRFQRRTLMIRGALAMGICQMGVAAAGFLWKHRSEEFCEMQRLAWSQPIPAWAFWPTMTGLGAFLVCYAITWGPGAWIVTGEIFPMQIRARGIGIATSTNWFSNTVIAFITPVLYDNDHLNLGSQVFFIWGAACFLAALFSYLCVPETKGLTLEQVDFIFEVAARKSGHEIPPEKRVGSMSTWSSGRRVSVISTATDPTLRV